VIKFGINDPLPEQSYYDGLTIVSNAITYVAYRPHYHETLDILFSARQDILDARTNKATPQWNFLLITTVHFRTLL
jgi:hypothetical protein